MSFDIRSWSATGSGSYNDTMGCGRPPSPTPPPTPPTEPPTDDKPAEPEPKENTS